MNSTNKTARWAGLLYFVAVVTGIFSLIYVPSQIHVPGNVSATVDHLIAAEPLYRLGIAVGALAYVAFAILPLVLYKLLSPVNKSVAIAMVVLTLIFIPIDFVAIATQLDVLSLLQRNASQNTMPAAQLQASIMALLDTYSNRIQVAQIFWGLWLLPFGYLVFRSRFLPRILGILLVLGGLGYLITFFAQVLFPHYGLPDFIMWPAGLGEIGTCLWLLIMGVRTREPAAHLHE